MGYYSRVSGAFFITPPITYAELKNAGYDEITPDSKPRERYVNLHEGWGELSLIVKSTTVDTPDGFLTTVTANEVAACEELMKAYHITASIERLISDFGETHQIAGSVYVYGEEDGDIWRIRINDNVVSEERPKLVWPDGTTTDTGR